VQASHVRYLRLSLLAVIGAVLLLVAFNYIQTFRRRAQVVREAKILSAEMARSGESMEYSEYAKGVLRFQIRAEKLLETRQGKNLLEGIEASERNPDGTEGGQIRSRKGEYDREHKQADFSEDVTVNLGQGLQLRTNALHYDLDKNVGSTGDLFEFTTNQAHGKARGFRYDHDSKNLYLNADVDMIVTRGVLKPDGSVESEQYHVTSDRGYVSRAEQLFRFEGNARLDSATAVLSGERIEASFGADMKRLTSLFCEGKASYQSKDPSSPRTLSGDKIVFGIASASGVLTNIDVQGHAQFGSDVEDSRVKLDAAHLILDLDPEKQLPTGIHGQGAAQFQMQRGSESTLLSGEQLETVLQGNALQKMRVWENAHMIAGQGGGDELRAGEIRLSFADVGGKSTLREMLAERSVDLQWSSQGANGGANGAKQSLKAAFLTMAYGQNGNVPESGSASGGVVITGIPSGPGRQDIRRLQSDNVQFQFYPELNRIREFSGEGRVQVLFSRPPGQAANSAQEFRTSSTNIRAEFQQSDGTVQNISQWGSFSLEDGVRTLTSGRSDYDAVKEILLLRDTPRLVDSGGTTTGETMEYDRKDKKLTVRRHVRSIMKPGSQNAATPFTSSQGAASPMIITAGSLEAWAEQDRARYSDGVQLLAETTQLEADSLERLQGGEVVQAQGSVKNLVSRQARAPAAKPGPRAKPAATGNQTRDTIRVQSDQLRYMQAERTIHYMGNVNLHSADIDISCAAMDALMDETGKEIEHASAHKNLLIRQGGRTVKGEEGEYFVSLGTVVVTGNPAEITDPQKGGKSQARRLTFFTTDDRILLDSPLTTGTARD